MIQVILNGARIGTITEANLRAFLRTTTMTVTSQTETTINLKG